MSLADWLVVSVTAHYVAIGLLYGWQQNQWMLTGLWWSYAMANGFLILLAQRVRL